ncbi:MAG: flagellar hook protein [Spirochaetales bacterium]|nr:MAG: flagellar hook protein [Spirochaetales bacterium]
MSDISIPGVTNKYDTKKLIEDLMKVERIPRDRAAANLDKIKLQKTIWLDLGRRLSSLRESARALYSFQNPFNERMATSSDPSILTATATREAIEETKSIKVIQTAAADRFMSDQLPSDYKVPAGTYTFGTGDGSVRLTFSGGSLNDFVTALNRKGGDNVRAQAVNVTADSRVLVIESLRTGAANRLEFSESAKDFGLSAGLIEPGTSSRRDLPLDPVSRFEKDLDTSKVRSSGGLLSIAPGGEAAARLGSSIPAKTLVMEIEIELADRTASAVSGPPPGPSIPATGAIEYEGLRVESAPSDAVLPPWAPTPDPPRVDNGSVLYLIDGTGRSISLPPLEAGGGFKTIRVPLSAYADSIGGLGVRNANTHRDVRVKSIRIFDPTEVAGFKPKNPVETARDSILTMDGIEITRSTNKIDDLIPGVIIDAIRASNDPINLVIEPNRTAAKEAVIDLVGRYNRLIAEINILTRNDPAILDEISYFTPEEKKTYEERLGLLQGDTTLSSIRTTLQRIVMDPYETSAGTALLSSMGVTTNASSGTGYDATRLRGYLEINEATLDRALKENFIRSKESLGFDSDRDLIVDSGAAVKIDNLMKGYVETGGIISLKTSTLDGQIARSQQSIATLDEQLARKEDDLKRKYGMMEGVLGQMESQSTALDNFGKQNQ